MSASSDAADHVKSLAADVQHSLTGVGTATAEAITAGAREAQSTLLAASQEAVAEHGFTAYTAEIGCLDGAGPALDIADGTLVSYLVFADVDAAQDFASVYTYLDDDAETPGVAEARTYCMDG